jgi:hypothetical protein
LWAELFDFKEVLREDVILLEMFDWDPGGDESGDKDDFIGCFKVCKQNLCSTTIYVSSCYSMASALML